MQDDEKFSDDPVENIRLENEFLKIKLKANTAMLFLWEPMLTFQRKLRTSF